MSAIVSSLSDLVKSMVEVVWSLFTTAGQLVEKTIQFVLHLFTSAINLIVEFGKGLVDLFGGIVSFLLGKSLTSFYRLLSTDFAAPTILTFM
jgi:type III secretory pathway component EscS